MFKGRSAGGSQERLPGDPSRYLVLQYEIDFGESITLDSILIEGAAFNGAVFRLLDSNMNWVWLF
jgi:hypothetical protein